MLHRACCVLIILRCDCCMLVMLHRAFCCMLKTMLHRAFCCMLKTMLHRAFCCMLKTMLHRAFCCMLITMLHRACCCTRITLRAYSPVPTPVAQLRRLSYGEMERCEMTDTLAFSLVLTKPHNAVTRRRKRPQTTTPQRATRWGPALAALWSSAMRWPRGGHAAVVVQRCVRDGRGLCGPAVLLRSHNAGYSRGYSRGTQAQLKGRPRGTRGALHLCGDAASGTHGVLTGYSWGTHGYSRGTHVLYVGVLQAVLTYSHGSAATLIAEAISSHIAVNVRSRRQL
jgi:hypothetical protein